MAKCRVPHCENTAFAGNLSSLNSNGSPPVNGTVFMFEKMELSLIDVLKLSLEVLIAMFGVVGNVLVVTVISRLGKKKSTTDVCLLNLAIADLGILLLSFPLIAIRENAPLNWPLGKFVCLYLYPVPDIFQGASVWYIAVIAVVRYWKVAILRKPVINSSSLRRTKIVTVCVWLVSFLMFSFPLYFVVEYLEFPTEDKWCGPVWPSMMIALVYIALLAIFSYILPLLVISGSYLAISRTLSQSSSFLMRVGDGVEGDKQSSLRKAKRFRLQQNKQAKRILTPIVVVFAITLLPLNMLRLTVVFWPLIANQEYYKNLLYIVTVFAILNSSANPVIYSITSKEFRKRVSKLYRKDRVTSSRV